MENHIQSNGLPILKDFERTRQKQNPWDMAHLTEGICGICPICDPLHCLLVVMLN
jgi:Ni,Fe-hydrogenase I large subunit